MIKLLSSSVLYGLFFMWMLSMASPVQGQLMDDFSDGNLTSDPTWIGDVSSFMVNVDEQLQLAASDPGTANLFTSTTFVSSLEWRIDVSLDFDPSNNNNVLVYLAINSQDPSTASGYILKIGENGADDTVELYSVDNGDLSLIGSGEPGIFATSPVRAILKVTKDDDNNWTVSRDRDFNGSFSEEFMAFDDTFELGTFCYFGIGCKFTMSNTDGFIFDNISVTPTQVDDQGPTIASVIVEDDQTLLVSFDEQVLSSSALELIHFNVAMIGAPISVDLVDECTSVYRLRFNQSFQNGATSELTVTDIEDLFGNINSDVIHFEVLIPEIPVSGDIIVNEILYDPPKNGVDFVEIKNISNKIIALDDLVIVNTTRTTVDSIEEITSTRFIRPSEIIAFTSNIPILERDYQTEPDQVIQNSLPPFVMDRPGNVSIFYTGGASRTLLDAFDYDESFHNALLAETKGVSLERISADLPGTDSNTWQSAGSSVGFATPGFENSQDIDLMIDESEILAFENLTFSPDNDGNADFLLIKLQPDVSGTVGRIRIFNAQGQIVRNLAESALLAATNYVQWNGMNNDGERSRIGPYIVKAEYVDDEGNNTVLTKTCVLAGQL